MSLIDKIKKMNILVIGDVMLDIYYNGTVNRISPEAPVPVFKKTSEKNILGGAANVAANLVAANQKVSIMTLIGDDKHGVNMEKLFLQKGIDTSLIIKSARNTTVKTRFIANNNQQIMRLDIEDTDEIREDECFRLLSEFKKQIASFNLIIISDYLKGLLSYDLTQGIIQIAKQHDIKVIIDVKDFKIEKYNGAFLLKPNLNELRLLTGMSVAIDEEIIAASRDLIDKCKCEYVLTTCGSRGMILVSEQTMYEIKSTVKEIFDVTGAGDTTIAYLAACLANKIEINNAVEISNYAAGLQVGKLGTSSIYLHEVNEFFENENLGVLNKLLEYETVSSFREEHKNHSVVFTNGCFDILHVGHIRYLQKAALLGDILIVGMNSDLSVKKLKGEKRPINTEKDRAELLCSLEYVDYVVIFNDETPYEIIKIIQPDILVKGSDYKPEEVIGKDIVEARGGELKLINFIEGKSTTNIIERISG